MELKTSAEALAGYLPGRLLASSDGRSWRDDLMVQIFSREVSETSVLVPAVPEPVVVWILSGAVVLEERDPGGEWSANRVEAGDFLLTMSASPYELRWKAAGDAPFVPMHVYLGLPLFERARREVWGEAAKTRGLREISGCKDPTLSSLLEPLRLEVTTRRRPSALFMQGVAQSLAIHLVRSYSEAPDRFASLHAGLPGHALREVTALMRSRLDRPFDLLRYASAAGMSASHFSRLFKMAAGVSPSQYFIRLRMAEAGRLLRKTRRSVIEIGLDVGYDSPSHFAQVFRREMGASPSAYRR